MLSATKVKKSGSEKNVNINTCDKSSIKRVTRKFLEVSRCSRAKQWQKMYQKECVARAKLLFLLFTDSVPVSPSEVCVLRKWRQASMP